MMRFRIESETGCEKVFSETKKNVLRASVKILLKIVKFLQL